MRKKIVLLRFEVPCSLCTQPLHKREAEFLPELPHLQHLPLHHKCKVEVRLVREGQLCDVRVTSPHRQFIYRHFGEDIGRRGLYEARFRGDKSLVHIRREERRLLKESVIAAKEAAKAQARVDHAKARADARRRSRVKEIQAVRWADANTDIDAFAVA